MRLAKLIALLLSLSPLHTLCAPSTELDGLFSEYDEAWLELNPHDATRRGDSRYDDRLEDGISPGFLHQDRMLQRLFRSRIDAIDRAALSEQQRISLDSFRFLIELRLAGHQGGFTRRESLMPFTQMQGLPIELALMGSGSSVQPFADEGDHHAWLRRAAQWPQWVEQAIANMRQGMREGVVLPRVLVEAILPTLSAHIVDDPAQSVFHGPVAKLQAGELRARLEPAYADLILGHIVPGYRRLHAFMAGEYLAAAREIVGRSQLPDGPHWYAFDIRRHTTLALEAAELHRVGLQQVALLHAEFRRVARELGFEGNLAAFFSYLRDDPRHLFESGEQALAHYRETATLVTERLPLVIGRLPRTAWEIRAVESFRAAGAAGASYQRPDAVGTRPGVFYLNTHDLTRIPRFERNSLLLHEAIPGHHLQIALASENTTLPAFQRFGTITAYNEGWALYAETLGKEMRIYEDPEQYLGMLYNRLHRANRLVIDTGLHALGWSRERAIRHFLDNSPISEADATAEVNRYISWPGQALAYMSGALEIARLREEAGKALGACFDLRRFNDMLLGSGTIPLPVLGEVSENWMRSERRRCSPEPTTTKS